MNTEDLVVSKLLDKRNICNNKNIMTNTKFLNGTELKMCLENLKNDYNYKSFGGFLDAERQLIVFYPDYIDEDQIEYPIEVIKVSLKKKMSHRDILGSLMGMGIKREMVGDILTFDDCAYIFALEEISDFIMMNLIKIGNQTVSLSKATTEEIESREVEFKLIKDTVSSIRFDSVVSSGFMMSRSKSVDVIRASNVYLNNVICTKTDQKVNVGDKISIRGKGKIVLNDILGKSKKDRIFIEIKKFI
ncbi:MAG: YlmH/Sll1252 family protein [Clostridia bacterium]